MAEQPRYFVRCDTCGENMSVSEDEFHIGQRAGGHYDHGHDATDLKSEVVIEPEYICEFAIYKESVSEETQITRLNHRVRSADVSAALPLLVNGVVELVLKHTPLIISGDIQEEVDEKQDLSTNE